MQKLPIQILILGKFFNITRTIGFLLQSIFLLTSTFNELINYKFINSLDKCVRVSNNLSEKIEIVKLWGFWNKQIYVKHNYGFSSF